MREHLRAELNALGWARLAVIVLGAGVLVYGAILAWKPHSAAVVFPIGAALLLLGLFLPADWTRLAIGPGGIEVDRGARIVQDTLAALPETALRELLPAPDELVAAEEAETEVVRAFPLETPALATAEVEGGVVRLRLVRQERSPARPAGIACAVRTPGGEFHAAVPRNVVAVASASRDAPTLAYDAIFPQAFDVDAAQLEAGRYSVFWSAVTTREVLAQSWFDWPPGSA